MLHDSKRFGPIVYITNRHVFGVRARNDGSDTVTYVPLEKADFTPVAFAQRCREHGIVPPMACQSENAFRRMINPLLKKMTDVFIELDADGFARATMQALENIPANGKVVSRIYKREVAG